MDWERVIVDYCSIVTYSSYLGIGGKLGMKRHAKS